MGIYASTHEHAWERAASVKPAVLDSDCQALAVDDLCTMAHVRYQEAARQADDKAAKARHGDPLHVAFERALPLAHAADYMGAAARSELGGGGRLEERAMRGRDLTLVHLSDTDRARFTNSAEAHKLSRLLKHTIRSGSVSAGNA